MVLLFNLGEEDFNGKLILPLRLERRIEADKISEQGG